MKMGHLSKHRATLRITYLSFLAICVVFPSLLANAQTAFKIGPNPVMTLAGTSTLHNWTMTAHAFTGTATVSLSSSNQLTAVSAFSLQLPVQNLKSESDGMNSNAYEALKSDKNKDIWFKLTSATVTSSGGSKYRIAALGNLTIAGVTKAITLNTTAQVNANGSISCSGSVPILLSNFGIERPSFMLGTMKVGDKMTLTYNLILVK
jgi:polyisoprenoid-binding protein YceI